jgi:hypothetical protein
VMSTSFYQRRLTRSLGRGECRLLQLQRRRGGNNGLDGGTGIHAKLTNPTKGSYSQISTQGLVRIASLV